MTHVSKKRLDAGIYKQLDEAFLSLLSNLTQIESKHVIATLLTPTEKLMILKRIGILSLSEESLDQENIAKVLKTTRQTVSRIDLQLLKIPGESKNFVFNKLKKWNRFQNFKKALTDATLWSVKKVLRASVGKT